jgi:UDP-galactopyranose mutase
MKKALLIGAGFAGCTYALLLKKKGYDVTLIEKGSFTGGGVRTFFHGGHPFTYGPRHFISATPEPYEFLKKYVPMRDIKKVNATYVEKDQTFYTYPIHEDDIPKMPECEQIQKELAERPEGVEAKDFEEFWTYKVGKTLYEKFVKHYNKKAWQLDSNTEMDFGFEATVKLKPMESGERHEFKEWINAYPTPPDGYNRYFDICLEGCEVLFNTVVDAYEFEKNRVRVGDRVFDYDVIISAISPDELFDYQWGELRYVGREYYNIVLPTPQVLPDDVYFLYFPNECDTHTRVVEYKKFTQYDSPHSLIALEVPSLRNKLYPTMIQSEVDKAQRYLDALPDNAFSVSRMGTYRYVDMDDVIIQAMDICKDL